MFCVHRSYLKVSCLDSKDSLFLRTDTHILCDSPLHTPDDDPSHARSAIQHFYDKLLDIKDRLKTEPGKRMGQKRHDLASVTAYSAGVMLTPVSHLVDVAVP